MIARGHVQTQISTQREELIGFEAVNFKRRQTSNYRQPTDNRTGLSSKVGQPLYLKCHKYPALLKEFTEFKDEELFPDFHLEINKVHMPDLNNELDYSTDSEKVISDQQEMLKDLALSIKFYVVDEPLLLVEQISHNNY